MAKSLNVVHLIGRTGREPSLRYTASGKPVASFSLVTDRWSKVEGQAGADWHAVVCWDQLAEFVNAHAGKGRLLYVSGRLTYRDWTGQDGRPRRTAEIIAAEVLLLDRPPGQAPADAEDQAAAAESDDDLPF